MKNTELFELMDEWFGRDAKTMSSSQVLAFTLDLLNKVNVTIEKAEEEFVVINPTNES